MQTFLPYPDFYASAVVLDRQRLGKQRVECLQLLQSIAGNPETGWRNHPCTKMWKPFPAALTIYAIEICAEWQARGYQDSCLQKILKLAAVNGWKIDCTAVLPDWLGNEAFHASHRSNLLRKSPEYYSRFGWTEPTDLEYVWNTKEGGEQ